MALAEAPAPTSLDGLLVALDLKGVVLRLSGDGFTASPAAALDDDTRALLRANKPALVAHLMERRLWELGRAAQAGEAGALEAYLALLAHYETACGGTAVQTANDVVVTCPAGRWDDWIGEGDGAGETRQEEYEYHWTLRGTVPKIAPGDRVYVVARGKLRGYAPLVRLDRNCELHMGDCLVREGDAVAVTIAEPIRGFQGWRRVWWRREDERPFSEWRVP